MTPFCINFPMNMAYYVAKRIVMPGMRQYILRPLSSYCLSPRVVLSEPPPVLSDTQYHRVYVIRWGARSFVMKMLANVPICHFEAF